MHKIPLLTFVLLSSMISAQGIKEIDSVSTSFCKDLKGLSYISNDTLQYQTFIDKHILPFIAQCESNDQNRIAQQLFFRLQKKCVAFRELLDKIEPPKEAVKRKFEKPISLISKNSLKVFKNQSNFKYYEVEGSTTKVSMKDGKWIDTFADGTYSKLDYKWISDTEFELIFLESDNLSRQNFSLAGDRYVYNVLSEFEQYYLMSVTFDDTVFEEFKLYKN